MVGMALAPPRRGSAVGVLGSQRSESVKSPGSPRTELFVAPVGVASKRHLFEKELVGQSRAEPASSRKVRGSGPTRVLRVISPDISKTQILAVAVLENCVFMCQLMLAEPSLEFPFTFLSPSP